MSIQEIRKAMEIDLENSIVILDEAHNIEDAARDAGGLDVLDDDLRVAKAEFGDMIKNNIMFQPSNSLLSVSPVNEASFSVLCLQCRLSQATNDLAYLFAFSFQLASIFLSILEKQTTFSIQEYEQSTEM